jgi:hypothetical protein
MAKERGETHLSEDDSEVAVKSLLPKEWVMRKLHPDYGVDITVEVFERAGTKIPTMGEFLFVQLKSTHSPAKSTIKIRRRGNVEKANDAQDGEAEHELDVVAFQIDTDTIDNARLMGPSTPLLLFLTDLQEKEVYYICLTDYYDKVLEPRGFTCSGQASVTLHIPLSNRLSSTHAVEVMRFFATRAKMYGMFNLAQFQFREMRYLLQAFSSHENLAELRSNFAIIERFARRLRAMPIWEREVPWALLPHYRHRLDHIIREIDGGMLAKIEQGIARFLAGDNAGLAPLFQFSDLCRMSWEQFSAIGQTFEDLVREWFLPTYVGQLGSGEEETFRGLQPAQTAAEPAERAARGS